MKTNIFLIHFKRAVSDIKNNSFLSSVTLVTIVLSILIVSTFGLFIVNVSDVMTSWKKGIRIMAYLKTDTHEADVSKTKDLILNIANVDNVTFINRNEAMKYLKEQMKRQASLFENLTSNPLPDAFEIRIKTSDKKWENIELIAEKIESLNAVSDVEYGQKWIGRFINIFNLFRLGAFAVGIIFMMVTIFIMANTIRLALYSRREEVEIMRLVGAEEGFITAPFYIQGVLQGAAGGLGGILILFICYILISSNIEQSLASSVFNIRFLPLKAVAGIIISSMTVGWLGCYISLKQFKNS